MTVVLCVNKGHSWLRPAIQSVFRQDDPDFEFLIVANACTNELWDELNRIAAPDPRVRLLRTSIGQLAYNLNVAADHARGDYLVRMDADDISEPQRLRTLRQALAVDPIDVLGSSVTLIDESDRVLGAMDLPKSHEEILRKLPIGTVFCHPAVAIRREFLVRMRGYLGGFASEDTDLWVRAVRCGARLGNISERLLRYRLHPQQATAGRSGYAEVAAHWCRELLLAPSLYTAKGFAVALGKCMFIPLLKRRRRSNPEVGASNVQGRRG